MTPRTVPKNISSCDRGFISTHLNRSASTGTGRCVGRSTSKVYEMRCCQSESMQRGGGVQGPRPSGPLKSRFQRCTSRILTPHLRTFYAILSAKAEPGLVQRVCQLQVQLRTKNKLSQLYAQAMHWKWFRYENLLGCHLQRKKRERATCWEFLA